MSNESKVKNAMPSQDAKVRARNFNEVALGYTAETAIDEATRCLNCPHKPCVEGCPVGIDIPAFIKCVAEGDFDEAYSELTKYTSLPAVCGRVCPQESQCEKYCVRLEDGDPVGIGRLERFVADYKMQKDLDAVQQGYLPETGDVPDKNGHKVAIIGSGPAGVTAAGELARKGYDVTIFEALHKAGGVLVYGIPEFRLPKAIVQKEIDSLGNYGVELKTNMVIGRVLTIDELFEAGYEAVFVGSGAGLPKFMNIPGESLNGVFSANEFLTRVNLMGAWRDDAKTPVMHGKKVAVVGGGNVAMDAARSALRLGADEVTIVYRRSMKELPARVEEVEHAEEEGVKFNLLVSPIEVLGDENGNVTGMTCIRYELGEPDESGRRRPVAVKGSEFTMDIDCMIMSIGTSPNPLIKHTTPGLDTESWGGIIAEEPSGKTTKNGVYAGGDAVTGAATVILAMGAGKDAANAIHEYVMSK
ncbi:MAG: NADPH-dependent glutamate synthase [Bifidobacteriaceae bacterium]|jgi:glutamate synthase (NADPH/NADH) small chain|nr:NADPH-dependent glutamate synthase [Bifidobacteriaceae bacterium]